MFQHYRNSSFGKNKSKILIFSALIAMICSGFPIHSFAEDVKVLEYNKEAKTIKVEIDGKEYELDVPLDEKKIEAVEQIENDSDNEPLKSTVQKKEYAKGPLTTTIGSRLFTTPTDNLLHKHGFAFDFTHRFADDIKGTNASDLWGLDNFAYTGLGLAYGIADNLEAHVYRTSVLDAIQAGLRFRMFREGKKFGEGAPFGLVLNSGFQTDDIQNSIDPYFQGIFSKVVIPKWFKLYASPTVAWKTPTIASGSSKSAIFFTFNDPKHRLYTRHGSTFAIPLGAVVQIVPNKMSLFGEYMPVVSGFKENVNGWSFGLQILSRMETHVWTIGVSNMPYSTVGNYITGAPNNDWHLGFNIAAMIK